MDTDELVSFQVDAGQKVLTQLVCDGFDVEAAFWVKTAEEDIWFLYIATPLVEQSGMAETYRAVQASLQKLEGIPLSLSDVKLIGVENPITKDVLTILPRYPGRLATRYSGKQLGRMTIEGAYIYPRYSYQPQDTAQMPKEDILREVIRHMNRGPGILQPSKVTLKDGDSFEGMPFSIQMGIHRAIVVQFIDKAEPMPRVVNVDDIASVS